MSSKKSNKTVSEILKGLKETAHRELGPVDYKRFVRKADAVERELKASPQNVKRLHKAIRDLITRLLKNGSNDADK